MERVKEFLDRFLMAVLVTQGICLVLIIGVAVFFRYVMGSALSWPEEVAQIIFVWYTLLGVVVLVGEDSHIAFDFMEQNTPPAVSFLIRIFSRLLVIVYGGVMAVYGWQYMMMFPDEVSPAAGINLCWLKISVPVAGVILIFFVCFNLITASTPGAKGARS
nr:TRAP transporter small permease [uncultured Desulfobacter sp.]